jgi:hypothetical protein
MASASFRLGAVDETKAAFASVHNSMQKLEKQIASVGKGFQLGNILKGVLSGLGVGSGMQIVQTLIDHQVAKRKEEADTLQVINKYTREQIELVRENILLRQNEEDQRKTTLKNLEDDRQALQQAQDAIVNNPLRRFTPVQKPGSAFRTDEENRANVAERIRDLTNEERIEVARLNVELQKVTNQIDSINAKEDTRILKLKEQEAVLLRQQRIMSAAAGLTQQEKAFDELIEKQKKANDEVERNREVAKRSAEQVQAQAEAYRKLIDPLRIYQQQLVEINKLESEGQLTVVEAARARQVVLRQSQKASDDQINQSLDRFFGDMDKMERQTSVIGQAANDLGFSFASAFEGAVLAGQKLSDVMRGLAQDVLKVFLRLSVTNPLINALFGSVPGFSPLPTLSGTRASGGPVSKGSAYLVGEEGPELFVANSSGRIIPNGKANAFASDGGGPTVNINYHIAAGVTRAELVPILETERKRLKAEIPDMVRRGGAYRAAFA